MADLLNKLFKDALWLVAGFVIAATAMTYYRTYERCDAFQVRSSFCETIGAWN